MEKKGVFLLRLSKAPCCSLTGLNREVLHLYSKPTLAKSLQNLLEPPLLSRLPCFFNIILWLCTDHSREGTFNLFTANEDGLATEPVNPSVGSGNLEVCAEFLSFHFIKKYMN